MSARTSNEKRKKAPAKKDAVDATPAKKDAVDATPAKTVDAPAEANAAPPNAPEQPQGALTESQTVAAWAIGLLLGTAGTAIAGFVFGPPIAVLVLAGTAAASVIALFWQSLRTLIGEAPLSSADTVAAYSAGAEEEQKRAVLRALKDLEFERNVGKISQEDYTRLLLRYRAEAKALLKQIDERGAEERRKAEALVARRFAEQGLGEPRAAVLVAASPPTTHDDAADGIAANDDDDDAATTSAPNDADDARRPDDDAGAHAASTETAAPDEEAAPPAVDGASPSARDEVKP